MDDDLEVVEGGGNVSVRLSDGGIASSEDHRLVLLFDPTGDQVQAVSIDGDVYRDPPIVLDISARALGFRSAEEDGLGSTLRVWICAPSGHIEEAVRDARRNFPDAFAEMVKVGQRAQLRGAR